MLKLEIWIFKHEPKLKKAETFLTEKILIFAGNNLREFRELTNFHNFREN